MELGDGRIEAAGAMVGLAVGGHAAASPDDSHRRHETRYEEATRLAMVVLKAARDCQRAILRARRRVRWMVQEVELEPR
jgi:hypothetical protein